MSRPWNKQTSASHLEPVIIGQFDTFNDWVNFAPQALTGIMDKRGRELKAICIDDIGRRCNVGEDFMRARDENTFPVRYFTEMTERALVDIPKPDIEVVAHRYIYTQTQLLRDPDGTGYNHQPVPSRGIVHGCEPSHHNGYPVTDVEGLYSKPEVDKVIALMQTDIDMLQEGFRHLVALSIEQARQKDLALELANTRIAELEKELAEAKYNFLARNQAQREKTE